jgi:parvulin-like peptidyl-prolyl isomerase
MSNVIKTGSAGRVLLAALATTTAFLALPAQAQTPAPLQVGQAPVKPKPVVRTTSQAAAAAAAPQAAAPQAPAAPTTQGMASAKATASGDIVGRVGDINVSVDEIRGYVASLGGRERDALTQQPALLNQAVRALLANRLVLQEVKAKKWDQQANVAAQLDRVRDSALVELYLQAASTPPASFPSDDELQKVYDANRAAFLMPRQFQLAQIFVAAPKDTDKATDDKAKAGLEDIQRKLKAGADFAALATEGGAPNGGNLGWLAENQVRPEIRTQVMGLAKSATSEPIRLDDGWHILKLVDTKASYTRTLPEVHDQLVQEMRAERAKMLRQAYLGELLKQHPPVLNELALSALIDKSSK